MKRSIVLLLATCCVALLASPASAVLYSDPMDGVLPWTVLKPGGFGQADSVATFGYDYSADGIGEAPNNVGGPATTGVKLESNNGDLVDVGAWMTLVPTGQNFVGDHRLRFDMWLNYSTVDREDNGGAGTTEFGGGGIGHDSLADNVGVAGAQIIVTNEGGSSNDYRAFAPAFLPDAAMAGFNHNASIPHHTNFLPAGSGVPPAIQGQPAGAPYENRAGSPGFQWFTWDISVRGDQVQVKMEKPGGVTQNTVIWDRVTEGTTTDGNISLFYADFFSSITANPQLTFGVIDNVVVTVPEPASALMLSLGALGLVGFVRRRR